MIETQKHSKIKISSEKNFGIVFSIFFFIIAIYPFFLSNTLNYWFMSISIFFLITAFFFQKILILPNKLWNKLGIFLGLVISPIIMLLIFVLTFIPIGIILKILGKDLINKKIYKQKKSYWIKRHYKMQSLTKQF